VKLRCGNSRSTLACSSGRSARWDEPWSLAHDGNRSEPEANQPVEMAEPRVALAEAAVAEELNRGAEARGLMNRCWLRCLTFELSGRHRQGAWAARCMMNAVGSARPRCLAGGGPLERRVRPRRGGRGRQAWRGQVAFRRAGIRFNRVLTRICPVSCACTAMTEGAVLPKAQEPLTRIHWPL
jgi:hypothetical protein